jgi:hypothetical protein
MSNSTLNICRIRQIQRGSSCRKETVSWRLRERKPTRSCQSFDWRGRRVVWQRLVQKPRTCKPEVLQQTACLVDFVVTFRLQSKGWVQLRLRLIVPSRRIQLKFMHKILKCVISSMNYVTVIEIKKYLFLFGLSVYFDEFVRFLL